MANFRSLRYTWKRGYQSILQLSIESEHAPQISVLLDNAAAKIRGKSWEEYELTTTVQLVLDLWICGRDCTCTPVSLNAGTVLTTVFDCGAFNTR